jgi:hypothetical protein
MSTCKICLEDFPTEDMIEDIQRAKYCLLDSGAICPNCGVYDHECEPSNERTINDIKRELEEGKEE